MIVKRMRLQYEPTTADKANRGKCAHFLLTMFAGGFLTDEEITEVVEQERKNPHYDLMYNLKEKQAIMGKKISLEPTKSEEE